MQNDSFAENFKQPPVHNPYNICNVYCSILNDFTFKRFQKEISIKMV